METTIIIVSYKSRSILLKNLNNFDHTCKVIVIENSKDENLKIELEQKYQNIKVILNENKGFGHGANIGAQLAKTKYIFFCSPDNFIKKDTVKNLEDISKKLKDEFGMLILTDEENKVNKISKVKEKCGISSFYIKRDIFLNMGGFDEKIFLYYEDVDFVYRLMKNNNLIFKVPITFKNAHGSHEPKHNIEIEVNRNWHYMWSKFYFKKKHYNYLYAFLSILPYFIRSILKILIFLKNPKEKEIYKARASGIFNSCILKDSWYRPKINTK